MPVIVVANPKGGVGKSTLATNIAGLYARQGHAVMLGDVDRQQSSRQWLALRPTRRPRSRAGTWSANRRFKAAQGRDARGARHAGRPARQAARCGDAHGRAHA